MPSFHFPRLLRLSLPSLCGILLFAAGLAWAGAGQPDDTFTGEETHQAKSGPWGVIEYNYLYIEATDELMANIQMPSATPHWVFEGATETSLRMLFEKAGLPQAMIASLLDKKRMVQKAGSLVVFPELPDLEAMTPAMRTVIYEQLALWPENEYHQFPMFFIGGVEEWLRDARIREELKDKIRKMAYPRGKATVFSDIQALLASAQSDTELRRIRKLITRTRTLIVRVKVTPQTDFNALYDYWSDQRRARDIRPFLESIAERPVEASLDLIHLLPRAARQFLYAYPSLDLAAEGRLPDCHWTSLNFFNRVPQDYYLDTRLASAHVLANYNPIPEPYAFGDVLFFMGADGAAIHSCVYLADNIVYTKNGENLLSPWILMPLEDVKVLYSDRPDVRVQGYRRKPVGS